MTYVIDVDTLSYVFCLHFLQNFWAVFCSSEMVCNRLPHSNVRAYSRRQLRRASLRHYFRLSFCLWISELANPHALFGGCGEKLCGLADEEI